MNNQRSGSRSPFSHTGAGGGPHARRGAAQVSPEEGYKDFVASELYCPKCKQAMPSRERHLLYLPSGDLYDYTCSRCGTSLATRRTDGSG